MVTELDYYCILQVHHKAEKEVIDAAYRRLAAKYHPDVSRVPDASERMKQINTAYEVLSDPARRAAYDASLGMSASPDALPYTTVRSRHLAKPWRVLLIMAGIILIAFVAFRLGFGLLLRSSRLVAVLVVIFIAIWLFLTLVKQKR
ncbi:MAG: DnaJ domain-containing protein [Dehalococcoidales bacterium]|nr:DnaJ domain-containing protein [Dehalococcoidales bacterium]